MIAHIADIGPVPFSSLTLTGDVSIPEVVVEVDAGVERKRAELGDLAPGVHSRRIFVPEQAWPVLHYLENRPAGQGEKLVRLMQEGRVEVTATLGNQTSELCGHEEQVRLLYPSFRLARRFGVPIRTAELNDIPGVSWGLAKVLSGSGIRYFTPGIQDYFATRLLKDATPHQELYVAFPFALNKPRFRLETSNSVIEPIRDQLPGSNTSTYAAQHWVSSFDDRGGVVFCSREAPLVKLAGLWPPAEPFSCFH